MLFFFNIRSKNVEDVDQDGMDLPSLEAARSEARRSAREMVAEMILQEEHIDGMRFEITDEAGRLVATIRFRDVIRLT
ncbi:hypothetical protein [Rhizobium sp. BK379]|uniref:DUF6894 family protein n=1 Tax=Rhizobium sp. BK379 TaxID=2587059 RepID=UPI00160A9AD9|nr:hypothetical protein [Rhizobium sp. BK379]MBB3444167.1 hypothetical protein [Rhizobium sp. BK379]